MKVCLSAAAEFLSENLIIFVCPAEPVVGISLVFVNAVAESRYISTFGVAIVGKCSSLIETCEVVKAVPKSDSDLLLPDAVLRFQLALVTVQTCASYLAVLLSDAVTVSQLTPAFNASAVVALSLSIV